MDTTEASATMRLQKYIARSGVASRRAAENLIVAGKVSVNGSVVTELGTKVSAFDVVCVNGEQLAMPQAAVTLMLHKPAGYVSTMNDPQGRPCIPDLIPVEEYPGLYHVGRLDRDTSGLLLCTTDGALGNGLLHPSREITKTYYALISGSLSEEELDKLRRGIELDDGLTAPALVDALEGEARQDALEAIEGQESRGASGHARHTGKRSYSQAIKHASIIEISIHEGRNRQVRRMFQALGHEVIALHRQKFAGLDVSGLARGEFRVLSEQELKQVGSFI